MTQRSDLDDFLDEEMRDPGFRAIWDAMIPLVDFGLALAVAREERRMKPKALAKAVGIEPAMLHRIEVGDEEPSLVLLTRLARALNARIEIGPDGHIGFMLVPQPAAQRALVRLNSGVRAGTRERQTAHAAD